MDGMDGMDGETWAIESTPVHAGPRGHPRQRGTQDGDAWAIESTPDRVVGGEFQPCKSV